MSLPQTHSKLVQTTYGGPLELKNTPTPQPLHGTAIVKILSASVLSYAKDVYNGTRKYSYPTPLTPGSSAIGRIAALGSDSTILAPHQLVFIDCFIKSRDDPDARFLLGLHEGRSEGSKKLMHEIWRDGTFAEFCRVPLENVYALREDYLVEKLGYQEADLTTIGRFLVPYGGLRDIQVQAGETVVVAPATGAFGGAAVVIAAALGANVIAMGRDYEKLQRLSSLLSEGKVKTVRISGDVVRDTEQLEKAAGRSPVDAIFDIPPQTTSELTYRKSYASVLKIGGRISLMGGHLGNVPFLYREVVQNDWVLKGKWMYSKDDVRSLIRMVETGILKIGEPSGIKKIAKFPLAEWARAFDVAEESAGWDASVVLTP